MKLSDVLSLLAKTALIMITVLLLLELGSHLKSAKHTTIKYELIDSDDWAESAHAIGVHPDSLTTELFLQHNSLSTTEEVRQFMLQQNKHTH